MNTFPTIRKLDSTILYVLELMSSISVLLLSIGLILSMSNVLTNGFILSDNPIMSRIWAVQQTVALDTGLSGSVYRVVILGRRKQFVQMSLYLTLSVMLLFTAVIVSNIESMQQTLGLTLTQAYAQSLVPVTALVWMRSICIVLLIIGHAVKHADGAKDNEAATEHAQPMTYTKPEEDRQEKSQTNEQVVVTEDEQPTSEIEQEQKIHILSSWDCSTIYRLLSGSKTCYEP